MAFKGKYLDPEKRRAYQREWDRRNPERRHAKQIKHRYGITIEQYDEMLERQGGVCAICRHPETLTFKGTLRALSVDHDHRTGRVRGLLCGSCNTTLGHLADDPDRLRAITEYLEEAEHGS